jgi:poly(A) polymerase
MDPIQLLQLCRKGAFEGAFEGAPADIVVPQLFSAGEFEAVWRRDPVAVRNVLDDILCAEFPGDGLELLLKSGVLHALFPELVAIKNLGDDPASAMHKDVWAHTKQVVAGVPNQLELRWGALMHDIGKARTRQVIGKKVTFHNHDIVGAQMLDRLDQRLDLFCDDATLFTTVRALVLNHLRPASYKKSWGDSGVRRLLVDIGGQRNFERLMMLSRADLTTKNPNKRGRALANAAELEARVKHVYEVDNAPKLPKGTMGVLMSKVATRPGPWLNAVREELEGMLRAGVLDVGKPMEYYVQHGLTLIEEHTNRERETEKP